MNQQLILNTITSVTQDRPLHRVLGHAHFSWLLSSRMSHWECMVTQRATPLCKAGATGSRTAPAPTGTGYAWVQRGPHPGIQEFLRMPRTPLWWRRVTWRQRPATSRLKQDLNGIGITRMRITIRIGTLNIRNSY